VIYLDLAALLRIAHRTLGGDPEVRDYGLLTAALARPQTDVFGHEAYPSLPEKAAALLHSLVRNHALIDGNKRLGWAAMVVFCDVNGQFLDMDDDAAYELTIRAAVGEYEVPDIAAELRKWGVS
jgi:death-on-curing protein